MTKIIRFTAGWCNPCKTLAEADSTKLRGDAEAIDVVGGTADNYLEGYDIDALKERILAKNLGSFIYDW